MLSRLYKSLVSRIHVRLSRDSRHSYYVGLLIRFSSHDCSYPASAPEVFWHSGALRIGLLLLLFLLRGHKSVAEGVIRHCLVWCAPRRQQIIAIDGAARSSARLAAGNHVRTTTTDTDVAAAGRQHCCSLDALDTIWWWWRCTVSHMYPEYRHRSINSARKINVEVSVPNAK